MIERAGIEADLGIKVHAHMLRHAAGYKLANDGVDTRSLQAYLGHKNIQNTTRYTALAPGRFLRGSGKTDPIQSGGTGTARAAGMSGGLLHSNRRCEPPPPRRFVTPTAGGAAHFHGTRSAALSPATNKGLEQCSENQNRRQIDRGR